MNKPIYKSKTAWGFGIAILGVLGQQIGILSPSTALSIVEVAATGFGLYGLRKAID